MESIVSHLQVLTNERLTKLIDETQLTLSELKDEMERRKQLQKEHEISDLDEHMKNTEISLATIRNFIHYLMEESKKR
jgi:DNA segregation ATPase FtsK/SpoIIIE-like protein